MSVHMCMSVATNYDGHMMSAYIPNKIFSGAKELVQFLFLQLLNSSCYGDREIRFTNENSNVTTGLFLHSPDDGLVCSFIVCSASCASSELPCVGFTLNDKLKQCHLITCLPEAGDDYGTAARSSDAVGSYFRMSDRFLAQSK